MIGNWEVYGLSEPELHYVLAEAYAEAAFFLASRLRNGEYPQTFSHAKVIMSLHHHAAELFMKYALSRAGESVPTHHHLRDLWHRYRAAYPGDEFDFQPPFVPVFLGYTEAEVAKEKHEQSSRRNRNKTDQSLRYHTDREGHEWPGAHGVIPDSYPGEIAGLHDRIRLLHGLIEVGAGNKTSYATSDERDESEGLTMPQGQESGARAVEYGLQTARKIANKLDAIKIGNARSNEYEIENRRVVIKCARTTTNSVGVPYQMLNRVAAVLGSFETESGTYDIYEMSPDVYRKLMRPTRSKGPSAGRVGIVRKSAFVDRGKFLMNLQID